MVSKQKQNNESVKINIPIYIILMVTFINANLELTVKLENVCQ